MRHPIFGGVGQIHSIDVVSIMQKPSPSAVLNSRHLRVKLNLIAIFRDPRHWRFHLSGAAREFRRTPVSRFSVLFVAGWNEKKIGHR